MTSEQRKSKIRWHCRRGMLELDLLLERFIQARLDNMTDLELDKFENLLVNSDPDLYAWLMGYESPTDKEVADFVAIIRSAHTVTSFN